MSVYTLTFPEYRATSKNNIRVFLTLFQDRQKPLPWQSLTIFFPIPQFSQMLPSQWQPVVHLKWWVKEDRTFVFDAYSWKHVARFVKASGKTDFFARQKVFRLGFFPLWATTFKSFDFVWAKKVMSNNIILH